jgi:membrane protease YdiL (CAAX protease family)
VNPGKRRRRRRERKKRLIILERFRFIINEVVWVFILTSLLLVLQWFLQSLIIDTGSFLFGLFIYLIRTLAIILFIPLVLLASNKLVGSRARDIYKEENISPSSGYWKLFKVTKKNYNYQVLYGILIFFFVFLPLNFLLFALIPFMIEYEALNLSLDVQNAYLLINNYSLFLIAAIIVQISISFSEEALYRGLLTKRGSEYYNKVSAVMISSYSYGFINFLFFFEPISSLFAIWFPIVWFLKEFLIGLILSFVILRKKWILPLIIGNFLNNMVFVHAIWNYLQGNDLLNVILYIYLPFLIIGVVLAIWQFSRIKESLQIGLTTLKTYVKNDEEIDESNADKYFRIMFDFIFGFFVFLMGILIAV